VDVAAATDVLVESFRVDRADATRDKPGVAMFD